MRAISIISGKNTECEILLQADPESAREQREHRGRSEVRGAGEPQIGCRGLGCCAPGAVPSSPGLASKLSRELLGHFFLLFFSTFFFFLDFLAPSSTFLYITLGGWTESGVLGWSRHRPERRCRNRGESGYNSSYARQASSCKVLNFFFLQSACCWRVLAIPRVERQTRTTINHPWSYA